MPELPEVETIRQAMAKAMIGKKFQSVQVIRHDLRIPIPHNLENFMVNKTLHQIHRRGKYIILELLGTANDKSNIIIHLGMSGRIHISKTKQAPLKHDHIIMYMNDNMRISFEDPRRFGMFYPSTHQNWEQDKPFSTMGPEPLDEHYKTEILFNSLKNKNTPIKTALLDQRIVAGLGNIYVCEALYRAGIHPKKRAKNITKKYNTLVQHIKDVLTEAIQSGGSSLKDYKHTDGSLGYFQHGFNVYDREGKKCTKNECRETIARITQSGRSTFFCPECQKEEDC